MPENILNRAEILIRQHRYKEAGSVLQNLLSQDPYNVHILAMLAEVHIQEEKYSAAEEIIEGAIGISPDADFLYYIKARIAIQKDDYTLAEQLLEKAIQLDPTDADYYALWASVKLYRKQYLTALQLADQCLQLQPDNLLGLNTRSASLIKLNRKDEAFNTIEGALNHDPNNAYTHTNYGWGLLEKGHHKKALEHFKEALKLNPNLTNAQAGMAEALKARYLLYRLFLQYSFWISNLTSKYQWGVIIGFYLVSRIIDFIAKSNEGLRPVLTPILIILAMIAFSTWIITPISNLFLRINPYGKYLLNKDEKQSSVAVGVSLIICITGIISFYTFKVESWLTVAAFGFAMMVPGASFFGFLQHNRAMVYFTLLMAIVGLTAVIFSFATGIVFNIFSIIFIIGFIGYQWVANYFQIKSSNK